MINNFFKVAVRNLFKHKGYTLINIMGLAVGVTCCILIMLFVKSEWSYDRFHSKADRIHRAWLRELYEGQVFINTVTPIPLGPVMQQNVPEVQSTCRVFNFSTLISYDKNSFNDPVDMVDSTFFNLFDFKLKEGDITNPFPINNSIIISEDAAKKYFGSNSAMGKTLDLQIGTNRVPFTVSGVVEKFPLESSIQFSMLIPFSNAPLFFSEGARTRAWSNVSVETYVLLKPGAKAATVNNKMAAVMNPLVSRNYKPGEYTITLQPITDIHLNSALPVGIVPISDRKYSYILGTIGILILLIACINFVTLSIGRSSSRALEVGVRKVLGAERRQLVGQFWGEAILLTVISTIVGIVLAFFLLKPFNQLANRELIMPFDGFTILFCLMLIIIIGCISGMYPAFVLSGFKPIQVLKGRMRSMGMGFFRKALVVGQFVASIFMIICTLTIGKQLNYLQNKDLGYRKDFVVVVPTNKPAVTGNQLAERFKTAISKNPHVVSSSRSMFSMIENGWMMLGYIDDKNAFRQFRINTVDPDFIETMGLKMVAGRGFIKGNVADSNNIIVNEALVREYGWKDPIGKKLPGKYTQTIIGVLKDFHFESLHTNIKPVVLALKPDSIRRASTDVNTAYSTYPRVSVRLRSGSLQNDIEFLRKAWKSVAGDQDFEYSFLDDALKAAYIQEQRLGNIVQYASFLSIFISCMGLFGLATLVVVRRTKEIGIRKVLGANVKTIVGLLSKDFVVMVLLAAMISFPIAWWVLTNWLNDFTYRINISLWIFLAAALLAVVIALFTVSFQAVRAALSNPVKSLRTE